MLCSCAEKIHVLNVESGKVRQTISEVQSNTDLIITRGWIPCKPPSEYVPVVVKPRTKMANDAKQYLFGFKYHAKNTVRIKNLTQLCQGCSNSMPKIFSVMCTDSTLVINTLAVFKFNVGIRNFPAFVLT